MELDNGLNNKHLHKQLYNYEPFYKTNPIVKDYLNRLGWKEVLKAQINMYRYNSKAIIFTENILHAGKEDNGYSPLYRIMKNADIREAKSLMPDNHNQFTINNFTRMISLCNNSGVKLIITTSPCYKPVKGNELTHSICYKYNIPYIDLYNTDYFNSHPELFYDQNHLNNDGAIVYTKMFFETLKPYLKGI